tara:strand:+ start:5706 stop:6056 length:351 start_codon:yes stop_codon:yes gene_type:complete
MTDSIYIGECPIDEDCAQLGSEDYHSRAMAELRAYINQLKRLFPKGDFRIKSHEHDFGTYYAVEGYYDEDIDDGRREAAFAAEAEGPTRWDAKAVEELKRQSLYWNFVHRRRLGRV